MKTPDNASFQVSPEQQEAELRAIAAAQEWAELRTYGSPDKTHWDSFYIPISMAPEKCFLAGHAAGKQEAERRIWAALKKEQEIAEFHGRRLLAGALPMSDMQRIIFGDEKV